MDPFGLFAWIAGLIERLVTRRQRIVLRADVAEHGLMSVYPYDDAHTVSIRQGVIRVYNGGPGRVTVNGAGWQSKDGTVVAADLPSDRTLDPGSPELEATGSPRKLVEAHDDHGGLVRMYVELAGNEKRRRRDLPTDWIAKIRALAERDRQRA